uniref:uncharacterized protein LOC108949844 n=1 Tax=Ciona intestinalis TaxID=7719 RepID=UPI00089DACE6|nr:uncharacterized protein LOC108949844 [Ciona intestinalis]|eukprot:XP_018669249.1 uncharacterized protein LOC108949844 [Ciona intestinalis]
MLLRNKNCSVNITNLSPVHAGVTVVYRVIASVFVAADVYLLVALVVFEIVATNKGSTGLKLRIVCMLAAVLAIMHEVLQHIILDYSAHGDTACQVTMSLKSAIYNLQVTATYIFLWFRQRMFYASPILAYLHTRPMEVLNWVILALLLVNPVIMFGFQWHGKLYEACQGMCLVLRQNTVNQLPFIAVAFSYAIIQVALVYLYLKPLYRSRFEKSQKLSSTKSVSQTERRTRTDPNGNVSGPPNMKTTCLDFNTNNNTTWRRSGITRKNSMEARMKRWLFLGLICILSDIISASIIAVFLLNWTPASLISVMFLWHDVSIFINVVCLIACFSVWKNMFFPLGLFLQNRR